MRHTNLTYALVREYLHYDADTGSFTWIKKPCNRIVVGSSAGYMRPDGYKMLGLFGGPHLYHRVAWLWMTGEEAPSDIDHIDGDPSNNAFANLRLASRSENNMNAKTNRTNKSGLKGAMWIAKDKRWYARITLNKRGHHLGSYDCPAAAHLAYQIAADKMFGEFARVA